MEEEVPPDMKNIIHSSLKNGDLELFAMDTFASYKLGLAV